MSNPTFSVLTVVGPDRLGIAEDISRIIARWGGDIKESRMAVLGGEFAAIVLVSMPEAGLANLQSEHGKLEQELNLRVDIKTTTQPRVITSGRTYYLETVSFDSPGIIQSVTALLKRHGINIEQLETETKPAPMSGTPTFRMRITLILDSKVSVAQLKSDLSKLEGENDLDINLRLA